MSKRVDKTRDNLTTIRVWLPCPQRGEVGHVSLQTYPSARRTGIYVSYWPRRNPRYGNPDFADQQQGVPGLNMPYLQMDTAIQNVRLLEHIEDLEQLVQMTKKHKLRVPDREILLFTLDVAKMEQAFQRIGAPRWSVWGSSYLASPRTTNCSGLVNHILTEGGIYNLVRYSSAARSGRRYCVMLVTVLCLLAAISYHLSDSPNPDNVSPFQIYLGFAVFEVGSLLLGGALGGFYDGWRDMQKIATVTDSIEENHRLGQAVGTVYSTSLILGGLLSQRGKISVMSTAGLASAVFCLGILALSRDVKANADEKSSTFKKMCMSSFMHYLLLTGIGVVGFVCTKDVNHKQVFKIMAITSGVALMAKQFLFGEVVCPSHLPRKKATRWKDKIATVGLNMIGGGVGALCGTFYYDHIMRRVIMLPEHIGDLASDAKREEEKQYNLVEQEQTLPPPENRELKELQGGLNSVRSELFRTVSRSNLRREAAAAPARTCTIL